MQIWNKVIFLVPFYIGQFFDGSTFYDTANDTPYLDDVKVNNLLFTNDLANFWLPEEDLQKENINIRTIQKQMEMTVKSKQNKNNGF